MNLWLLVCERTPIAGLNPVPVWVGRMNGTIAAGFYRTTESSEFFENVNGERIEDARQWMRRKVPVLRESEPYGIRMTEALTMRY